jgi:hypothetical protein
MALHGYGVLALGFLLRGRVAERVRLLLRLRRAADAASTFNGAVLDCHIPAVGPARAITDGTANASTDGCADRTADHRTRCAACCSASRGTARFSGRNGWSHEKSGDKYETSKTHDILHGAQRLC